MFNESEPEVDACALEIDSRAPDTNTQESETESILNFSLNKTVK